MDISTWALIFAGAAFFLNLFQRIFGGGWNLSRNLATMKSEVQAEVGVVRRDLEEQQKISTREVGETISALKEHVRQVEFHLRDNYIRKDDILVLMKSNDEMLRLNFENITQRLDRIEKTLDHSKIGA